eukprot:SAG31_NODE_6285_length_2084_cov_3.501259_3_plen_178_part_00
MSHRSSRGHKYVSLFKCPSSGWPEYLFHVNKNDFNDALDSLITARRADSRFQYPGYKFCEQVYTDIDGSWSDVNAVTEAVREKHGIKFIYTDPSGSKNKNARGEKMCRDAENAMKALMIHYRIPIGYWDYAMASALETRRLFPITRNIVSPDGDRGEGYSLILAVYATLAGLRSAAS